ncbi:MAG: asparagine synthase-related protein [Proteobacteria bacterium]|nr:asparagine synthase-related protein [Pseudomonadota bacterium]
MAGFYGKVGVGSDSDIQIPILPNLEVTKLEYSDVRFSNGFIREFHFRGTPPQIGNSLSGNTVLIYTGFIVGQNRQSLTDSRNVFADSLATQYEEQGISIFSKLNGNWAAVAVNRSGDSILLVADRLVTIPIYYSISAGTFEWSTSFLGLLQHSNRPNYFDPEALTEYMVLGYPLDNRTYVQNIHALRNGQAIQWKKGLTGETTYWQPRMEPDPLLSQADQVADDIKHLIDQAVIRFAEDGRHVGMTISGGLDSRQLIARLGNRCELGASTGLEDHPDISCARAICNHLGIPYQHCFYDFADAVANENKWIDLNDGSICTGEYIVATAKLAECCDVVFFGAFGDAFRGKKKPWPLTQRGAKESMFAKENLQFLPEFEIKQAMGHRMPLDIQNAPKRNFFRLFDKTNTSILLNKLIWHNFTQRQRRRIATVLGAGRGIVDVRFPLADIDFMDFMLRLPPEMRHPSLDVYRLSFNKHFPELAGMRNGFGITYLDEAKQGWFFNDLKARLYTNLPSYVREQLKNKARPELLLPSHLSVFGVEREDFVKERLFFLVELGILSQKWVSRVLEAHFSTASDRSSLLHKLIPLSIVAERYRISLN